MAEKPDRILTAVNIPLMEISRGINMIFIVNIHMEILMEILMEMLLEILIENGPPFAQTQDT